MHMHGTIKNNTITHIWIQIIPCLNHRYIHEFYSFFLLYFVILFLFLDINMSLLFLIGFFFFYGLFILDFLFFAQH